MKTYFWKIRRLYLAVGVLAMLFAGVIYSWSILKVPLAENFGWDTSQLTVNFTLTMCFFCIGAVVTGIAERRIGIKPTVIAGAALAFAGFQLSARITGERLAVLYLCYGMLSGLGIGMSYSCILSAVGSWFPDKKGTCSGVLLMSFGASTLLLGNCASRLFEIPFIGWRGTYAIFGAAIGIVLLIAGIIIRRPGADAELPQVKIKNFKNKNDIIILECSTASMLKRPSFWLMFFCIIFLAAVGNSTISVARDLSLSVGASEGLATTMVGVIAVCNGIGRVFFGSMFDKFGCRRSLLIANAFGVVAAGISLCAVATSSVALCVVGMCFAGLSYGACPTSTATLTAVFYGQKHFPLNFSIQNFNLIGASLLATAFSLLFTNSGGYILSFVLLLTLSVVSLVLGICLKRP